MVPFPAYNYFVSIVLFNKYKCMPIKVLTLTTLLVLNNKRRADSVVPFKIPNGLSQIITTLKTRANFFCCVVVDNE